MEPRASSSLSITSMNNTLTARDSLQQIRRLSEESIDGSNVTNHERMWRLSYLKGQFETLDLGRLFHRYTQRINHGYFSLFLLLLILLSVIHFVVVLWSNIESNTIDTVIPDLVIYATIFILCSVGIVITDFYVQKHHGLLTVVSSIAFMVLLVTNFFPPIYHTFANGEHLRPAYTTLLITACYIFFNITHNTISIILGIMVTVAHVVVIILITYSESSKLLQRVASDIIYLLCINGLGVYFRFLNEIVKRKGFLDRRACVESTLKLKFEKKQEEQLTQSIIPEDIAAEVRMDMLNTIRQIEKTQTLPRQKPFENPYIKSHENVTILYADIVNYTEMTTQLKPATKLVETLNDLFGRFDDASEELKVLRIKFLGDCYYCVAGLPPDCIENHAEACVDLGLQMIKIIRDVREQRNLKIDMRIGIHTGNILSGLIGLMKWQYDVWSNDVDIANRMETRGVPGKVHITKQTKDLLKKTYNITPTTEGQTDPLLKQYKLETFLITPPPDPLPMNGHRLSCNQHSLPDLHSLYEESELQNSNASSTNNSNERRDTIFLRRPSGNPTLANLERRISGIPNQTLRLQRRSGSNSNVERIRERRVTPGDVQRRTAFMDNNIHRYHERLRDTDTAMKKAIETMPLAKYEQWFKVRSINPVLLIFRKSGTEAAFFRSSDPLFKYYLLEAVLVLISITIMQNLTLAQWDSTEWLNYVSLALLLFVFVPIAWMHYIWNKYLSRCMLDAREPHSSLLKLLYMSSMKLSDNVTFRIIVYVVVCMLFFGCVFEDMLGCRDKYGNETTATTFIMDLFKLVTRESIQVDSTYCIIPWHMSETCILAIFMSFSFLRIHLWIKTVFSILITVVYAVSLWSFGEGFYESSETINPSVAPKVAHTIAVASLAISLHLIDRQTDYMNRLDYEWSQKLMDEREEANKMHKINNILLTNILPVHVADLYLNVNRQTRGLYHESYDNVAVMFASVVGYASEGISQRNLLELMNEVIGDFDKLLNSPSRKMPIEKIKVAKWTYMAACGLEPGRRDTQYSISSSNQENHVVVCLVEFAAEIFKALEQINRESTQEMKVRIGIAHGELTAGVIGSKKPFYDIWGDPVNMASRMDSTGLPGKIQVPYSTAQILMKQGIACEFRDNVRVKGIRELVPTYFVTLDNAFNIVWKRYNDESEQVNTD